MKLQLIFDEKPRGGGGIGASAQIAKTLHQQGIDTTILLYDESLELATSGDFNAATERLQMLLCLNPGDGGSHFLLAKTLAAMKEWQKSIFHLKKAAENGIKIPKEVRTFIDQGLQRELRNTDIERKRALQRDRTELNQLKNEIRRLRSKNSSLNNENLGLVNSLRTWMYACAIIAGSFAAIFIFMLIDEPEEKDTIEDVAASEPIEKEPQPKKETVQAKAQPKTPTKPKENKKKDQLEKKVDSKPTKVDPPKEIKVEKPTPPEPVGFQFPLTHTIKSGDSYTKLAEKYYGSHRLWKKIETHNNIPANRLKGGQKIEVPAPD